MLKKLAAYTINYRKAIYLVPLFVLFDVAAELSMPLLMARIVDVGIARGDVPFIARTGGLMVLLALFSMATGVAFIWLSTYGALGFGANLRAALFARVQQFSFTNIDQFSTASLVTRATNDVNNIQTTFMMMLRMLLRAPLMLIIAFVLALSINRQLSLVLAVAIPVLVISVGLIIRTATRRFTVVQARIDGINAVLQENLIGQRVVKAFVRRDFEAAKFQTANDSLTTAFIRAVSLIILNFPVMMLVLSGATVAIIWQGGHLVAAGSLGAGQLISFISYVFMILMSVMMISMIFVMAARAQASARRVLEVLDTEIDIVDPDATTKNQRTEGSQSSAQAASWDLASSVLGGEGPAVTHGRVEFRDVSFKYNGSGTGEDVLSHISFTAEPGQIVGVVGGTGAGKSTLVSLIPRLYDVTGGAVLVDGRDVRAYPLQALRDGAGMVLQNNTLFSGTIKENLLWGRPAGATADPTQDDIEAAARAAQAHDFILSFPQGYDSPLGQGGVNVSGGQKQRLTIARALLKQPKILILDDSTSAVDSATEARIREALRRPDRFPKTCQVSSGETCQVSSGETCQVSSGETCQVSSPMTVFIIAQRISSVRDADKILVLDDGKLVGWGTHDELLRTNTVYQEINQSQQEGVLSQ